jgi:hypothetical protein
MIVLAVYRMLLRLYPNDFRQQFAEEMFEIFRQKSLDLAAVKGAVLASFVLREFSGLPIGATAAWIVSIMPRKNYFVIPIPIISEHFPSPTAEESALSTPELQHRHDAAKASMLLAGASHDESPLALMRLKSPAFSYSCGVGTVHKNRMLHEHPDGKFPLARP